MSNQMSNARKCSFCGRDENQTDGLLPGILKGFICFDCVERASSGEIKKTSAACDFCGKEKTEASPAGNGVAICSVCLQTIANPAVLIRGGFVIDAKSRFGKLLLTSENRFIKKHIVGG
jgi:ribosomal protein L37AE/L43A